MKRTIDAHSPFFLLVVVAFALIASFPSAAEATVAGEQVIFVVQADGERPKDVLEKDAILIARRLEAAKAGDSIQVVTTSGVEEAVSFSVESAWNPLQKHRAKRNAMINLRNFFLRLFKEAGSNGTQVNDIAVTLKMVMDRVNFGEKFKRTTVVLLTSGFQRDKSVDWRGYIPSDSWVQHPDSPFSYVPSNKSGVPLRFVMLPFQGDFVDTMYHSAAIERWYDLFFSLRGAQLAAFTFDHAAAEKVLLKQSMEPKKQAVKPIKIDGPLRLTRVTPMTTGAK